ncbi:hypothetical protein CMO96_01585, partial [Candidatus Woesebacteria bacterium]|nr:hypothetical protein [Candidatus Woesebacteria bacterium]
MNITTLKHIHFTGIKGVGMTSLALCAKDLGIKVTGSDTDELFVTDETLKKNGVSWKVGFSEKNLKPRPDLVITTGAHGGFQNPEVVAAKNLSIPVIPQAQALAEFAKEKDTLAVCGVGGKSTVSAMIATILDTASNSPSFAIGVGDIPSLGVPGKFDKDGKEFVCEADEFVVSPGIDDTPKFLLLSPKIAVVTNIEHDHPDVYPEIGDTKKAFRKFFQKIPQDGLLVAHTDNKNVTETIKELDTPIQSYGMNPGVNWQITNILFEEEKTLFSIKAKDGHTIDIVLQVPGEFNTLNATAAFIVGKQLGISDEKLVDGLRVYSGCRRRFEKIGEKNGI